MREMLKALALLCLTLPGGPALARGHGDCLSHHWECPAYAGEVRLQIAGIAVAAAAVLVVRAWKKGSAAR